METNDNIIEPLLEKAMQYSKTSIELLKLEALSKVASAAGSLLNRLILSVAVLVFILFSSVAAALWLGQLLGEVYYGFLLVAAFYGIVWVVLLLMRSTIKKWVSNSVIAQILHD